MVLYHNEKEEQNFNSVLKELELLGKKTTNPVKEHIYELSNCIDPINDTVMMAEISVTMLKTISLFTNFPYDRIRYGDIISVIRKLKEFKEQVKEDFYIALLKDMGDKHEH